LIATGFLLPALAVVTWRWVARSDADAVIPERELAILRGVPMLAPLPMTILEQVASDLAVRTYQDGERIIQQGEVGDRFYILAAGRAEAVSDGVRLRAMGPGDSFGEIALIRDVPRTASVVAVGPVEAFALDCSAFLGAVSGDKRSSSAAEAVVRERLAGARSDAEG